MQLNIYVALKYSFKHEEGVVNFLFFERKEGVVNKNNGLGIWPVRVNLE